MMMQKQSTMQLRSPTGVRPLVQRRPCTKAAAQAQAKSGLAKWADSVGMPTDDGVFGFTPFAEMWVGRWAQLGFVSSIVVEFTSGRGTLQQLGLASPSTPVLIALCALAGGATLAGTINTVQRATSKKMSKSEIDRYKSFLGLNNPDDYKEEAAAMKKRGDFTTVGVDQAAINAARANTPVDGFLSTNELAEGQAAAQEMKATTATLTKEPEASIDPEAAAVAKVQAAAEAAARARQYEEAMYFGEQGEMAYARGIELTNGRWAMVGFLAAILVEASTGQGIIAQLISIFKWSGLLGEASGF